MRALNVARRSAVKAQQAAWRQIGALLVNAPAPLRDWLRGLTRAAVLAVLVATRPGQISDPDDADILFALRSVARRHRDLADKITADEITAVEERLHTRVAAANPALLAITGVGPVIGAQLLITAGDNPDRLRSSTSFAALCGTTPIPVSSGRTDRHRLSRRGARAANAALHHIVNVQMSCHPTTHAYRDTRINRGWTNKAVFRALKRAVAREIHRALTGRCDIPTYTDLRPAQPAKNITLTQVAQHFAVWPTNISRIELRIQRNDTLPEAYREWLHTA